MGENLLLLVLLCPKCHPVIKTVNSCEVALILCCRQGDCRCSQKPHAQRLASTRTEPTSGELAGGARSVLQKT